MSGSEGFRRMFEGAVLEIDDLFLLEAFQIAYLPGWVPEREFAAALIAKPHLRRFLVKKCPSIAEYVSALVARYPYPASPDKLAEYEDQLAWTIADLLVYNKCPEVYDGLPFHGWDFGEITSLVNLEGKTVIDGGSGTGRVALEAARHASLVFAVEPVARLREFIRTKAQQAGIRNVFVVDGFLQALPFPSRFADVIITSHAVGWHIQTELVELERVVKRPGAIIHCPGTMVGKEEENHRVLIEPPWSHEFAQYQETDGLKRRYWKRL